MRLPKPFFALIFIFSSCATIINRPLQKVHIITSKPAKIIVMNDTLRAAGIKKPILVNRGKEPLTVTTVTDSVTKQFQVKAQNSAAYNLNNYPIFWPGILIDKNKPVRYGYPKYIELDLEKHHTSASSVKPLDSALRKYSTILKFTPLKIIAFSNQAVEFALERKLNNNLSTQISAGYLIPDNVFKAGDITNVRGFTLGIEERFYYKNSMPKGPYLAVEIIYLNSKYTSNGRFYLPTDLYDEKSYYDDYQVNKQTLSLNSKLGYQSFGNRLVVDMYIGLGLRYKNVKHTNKISPQYVLTPRKDPDYNSINNREGTRLIFSFPLNIRIGWLF